YQDAIMADPKNVPARVKAGQVYAKMGHDPEAIEQWNRAIALDPGNGEAQEALGAAFARREARKPPAQGTTVVTMPQAPAPAPAPPRLRGPGPRPPRRRCSPRPRLGRRRSTRRPRAATTPPAWPSSTIGSTKPRWPSWTRRSHSDPHTRTR